MAFFFCSFFFFLTEFSLFTIGRTRLVISFWGSLCHSYGLVLITLLLHRSFLSRFLRLEHLAKIGGEKSASRPNGKQVNGRVSD